MLPNNQAEDEFAEYERAARAEEAGQAAQEEEAAAEEQPEPEEEQSEPAEVPEPDPEPEPKPEPEPAKSDDAIPKAVFLREKRERQAAQRLVEELSSKVEGLSEQIKSLQPKQPAPARDDDPFGYLDHQIKQTQEAVQAIGKNLESSAATQQQQSAIARLDSLERDFASQTPDYYDAVTHLRATRYNMYTEVMGMSEEAAMQQLQNEAAMLIRSAVESGKSFPEVTYALAKQHGFAPKTEAVAPEKPGRTAPDGQQTLKQIAKAQGASRTLAATPGKSKDTEFSVEDANGLDDDDFDKKFLGNEGDKAFAKMFQ